MDDSSHGGASAAAAVDPPGVTDRSFGGGAIATLWPLVVLAGMLVMIFRSCVPMEAVPVMPAFDAAAAARLRNERAFTAISALGPESTAEQVGQTLNLIVVNFASGSAEVPADTRMVLKRAASLIATLPASVRFEISGHTDSNGSPEGNLRLSEQRARAVSIFLVKEGAPPDSFLVKGYGDARPVADNHTEQGRFGNRRIEFAPLP